MSFRATARNLSAISESNQRTLAPIQTHQPQSKSGLSLCGSPPGRDSSTSLGMTVHKWGIITNLEGVLPLMFPLN
jgi:hypothetical protein